MTAPEDVFGDGVPVNVQFHDTIPFARTHGLHQEGVMYVVDWSQRERNTDVAYCRGPYCLMSFEAVEKLRKRGWKARRLQDGFPEWRAAGLPVER